MPWFYSRSRFRDLEERLEKVERELRATTLEAADLYEKARSALGRAVKRGSLTSGVSEPPAPVDNVPAHLKHLDPVSQKIHMQRMQRFNRTGG
jgi:hypothetical protein